MTPSISSIAIAVLVAFLPFIVRYLSSAIRALLTRNQTPKPPQEYKDPTMSDDKLYHVASLPELQTLFKSTTYVAVDFYADWCGPCKTIAPMYQKLAATHGAPGTLAFAKVNVDHAQDVAREYGISAMPTFLFFKEGRQVAVNGQKMIRGADVNSLNAAAAKLGGLAKKKAEEVAAAPATEKA